MRNMRATFLAGGAMGVVAAGFLRRPIVPGMLTIAGVCTGAQLAFNEVSLMTHRVMSTADGPESDNRSAPSTQLAPPPTGTSTSEKPKSRGFLLDFLERHDIVVPLSDAQYKERLLQRRSEIDRELILLEQELAQERRQLHKLETTGGSP